MHSQIVLNDRLVNASKTRVPAVSLYGRGVFTTLAIHNHKPFLWQDHLARLTDHARRTELDLSDFSEEAVTALLERAIEANKVKEGRARVTLLATSERGVWELKSSSARKTNLIIFTGALHASPESGLALTISPYRVNTLSPLAGIKSVNYLERMMSWEEARARDFDEAVVLNERGEIVSGTMANIFWVTDGTLHTPILATGALAGTTRAKVIELTDELSIPLVEGVYELSDLADADEIFLTSATQGVAIVTTFDFHRYSVAVGSVALRLHEAFRQLTLQVK